MGQKVHPFGFRVGITEAHKSRWYAPKALYGELLVEDYKIRDYCDRRLNRRPPFAAVSDIHIERTREELKIIIKTARPGLVIGPKGAEIDQLTADLQELTGRNVSISCIEVANPDADVQLIAESIAAQLAETERVARRRGGAIAIGHPHTVTLEVLERWIPDARARGFILAPISAMAKVAVSATTATPVALTAPQAASPVEQ